ncbi:CAMK protein kinase [Saprolegnia parasitica CBS 223.65]|uniref:CAMK protein kinase n=1 Tax=Saprolegnia parasitica (strain CBS 223.65) TaxID=695850 RepID=A0A067CX97_SAPPC|nr:CAMK protein kinase [Saprolegnia parasitica CBS 223.65]KDO35319.1 CAMK protein kinase [Saprolegnia parasitica CBS 223.65]|eukprot:XP_012193665.1 CAMK protein kinase [Saprolegnia parasitica CBS 223.65]
MDFGSARRGGRNALPEDFVRKPWQSFSTMKRFLSEAIRLENASWRIWFMQQRAKQAMVVTKKKGRLSIETLGDDVEADEHNRTCVYCELAPASLTCNGCCHDPYCVSCFKLIHMRGHLASHTAVSIQKLDAKRGTPVVTPTTRRAPEQASPTKVIVATKPVKSWEEKMDVLFQKLMVTSMHHDGDISVHNIDNSPLNPTWSPDQAKTCGGCQGPHMTIACPTLASPMTESPAPTTSKKPSICGNCRGDHKTLDCHKLAPPTPSKSAVCGNCRGDHMTISCPQLAVAAPVKPSICGNCRGDHKTLDCHKLAPPTPSRAAVCSNCSGAHMSIACPLLLLAPPPKKALVCGGCGGEHMTMLCPMQASEEATFFRRKSSKGIVCGNCRGDHMTISCPQLQEESPKHVVDSIVRKCFTSYHNANTSNSTHAYLGDEVSVHGAGFAPPATRFHAATFAPIHEIPVEVETSPVLPALSPLRQLRTPDVWILSSLWNEMSASFLQTRGHTGVGCDVNCLDERRGWVYLKPPHCPKWRRRFVVLFRNQLTEFLDERDVQPVGFANLHEASIVDSSAHGERQLTVAVASSALRDDGITTLQWCFDTPLAFDEWKAALLRASRLEIQDLFGDDDVELGKGRFAMVKRAERRHLARCSHECAIKVIDKAAFWDLVQQGVERNDTLFREVLTQSVLTLRGHGVPHHGYVVRLLSLFETHDHLVMEMELMAGGDIYDHIVTHGPLPEPHAALVMTHLIQSIQFCLENGIAHRDVKISNLALDVQTTIGSTDRPCVLKLADFGMSAFLESNGMLLGRCGTPGYVAPEILTAGVQEPYPPHVDMFSAGVVLYTLLCGYEPFYAINDKELILLNKAVTYFFHPEEWSHISDDAKDLIARMLAKNPSERVRPHEALAHPFLRQVSPVPEHPRTSTCTKLF